MRTIDNIRRFRLSDTFVEPYKVKEVPWGPLGYVTFKRTLTSRANTYQKDEVVKRPKLSHMLKDELIKECIRRNIACIGTVRVLRERLRLAREEEKQT